MGFFHSDHHEHKQRSATQEGENSWASIATSAYNFDSEQNWVSFSSLNDKIPQVGRFGTERFHAGGVDVEAGSKPVIVLAGDHKDGNHIYAIMPGEKTGALDDVDAIVTDRRYQAKFNPETKEWMIPKVIPADAEVTKIRGGVTAEVKSDDEGVHVKVDHDRFVECTPLVFVTTGIFGTMEYFHLLNKKEAQLTPGFKAGKLTHGLPPTVIES